MNAKDYQLIVRTVCELRGLLPDVSWMQVVTAFVRALAPQHIGLNVELFVKACDQHIQVRVPQVPVDPSLPTAWQPFKRKE